MIHPPSPERTKPNEEGIRFRDPDFTGPENLLAKKHLVFLRRMQVGQKG